VNRVFLDTSGLIAVTNVDDQWHSQAELVWGELVKTGTLFLTTSLILIEIADGLSRIRHRSLAIDLCDRLRNSSQVEIVRASEVIEAQAWDLFRQSRDKEWGMTDCTSFVVMRDRNIHQAFTNDRHFEQAGFIRLLPAQ
jgi:predicted nucleic acid-binding protein